ncbi:10944_t:CDS:2, partial [Acaulospora colombiana]
VDPADNVGGPPTGREVAIGYLRGCMRGRTLEWFDDEITTKANWELTNLTDGTGQANLVAVNGRTAIQIGADGLNEALGQPGTAIVKLRAVEGPWDEDWRVAGGRPTNAVVNLPNAGNGTTVVVPGIRFGQAIWWLKTHFPTIEEELRDLQYGTIRKGSMTIDENSEDIGEHLPLDELAKKLYEIELRRIARNKRDRIPDPLVSQQIYDPLSVSTQKQQGISLEDMQKAFQNAVVQQKTEFQSVLEKRDAEHKAEIESILQQKSKKIPPPIPPKNTDEIDSAISLKELYGMGYRDGPLVDFMETYKKRSNDIKRTHNDRIGRVEKGLNETRGSVNQLIEEFQKININKDNIAKSNFTRSYFTPLKSLYPQYEDDDNSGYEEENGIWLDNDSEKKKQVNEPYDQQLPKLSPEIRKMCLSQKILDLNSGNSKHITDSLGWYTDVPVTLKDKENKTVTIIGNFVRIDNGESKPMLFLGMSNIRKVQVAKDPPKETEITETLDSDELETRDSNSSS